MGGSICVTGTNIMRPYCTAIDQDGYNCRYVATYKRRGRTGWFNKAILNDPANASFKNWFRKFWFRRGIDGEEHYAVYEAYLCCGHRKEMRKAPRSLTSCLEDTLRCPYAQSITRRGKSVKECSPGHVLR